MLEIDVTAAASAAALSACACTCYVVSLCYVSVLMCCCTAGQLTLHLYRANGTNEYLQLNSKESAIGTGQLSCMRFLTCIGFARVYLLLFVLIDIVAVFRS